MGGRLESAVDRARLSPDKPLQSTPDTRRRKGDIRDKDLIGKTPFSVIQKVNVVFVQDNGFPLMYYFYVKDQR
jgi:hypothetical protein